MNTLTSTRPDADATFAVIERALSAMFARQAAAAEAYGPEFAQLWTLTEQLMRGGKLVRPLLLIQTFDAIREESRPSPVPAHATASSRAAAVTVAAATEALHFAFLLHDDVIDDDLVRRGKPNLIGELALMAGSDAGHRSSQQRAAHWGQTGGILAGDLLLSAAHQSFARLDVETSQRTRLLDLLEHTVIETTAGEYLDVGLSDGVVTPDLTTVLAMTTRKTATYTFELPLRAAAILAGASPALERALSAAGTHLGLAYQLQDDLLSTFGDSDEHGKVPFSDLREGKQTAIMCFARLTSAWPSIVDDFGDPEMSSATAQRIRERLRDSGAERFVQGLVEEQLTACYEIIVGDIDGEAMPSAVRSVLLNLAERLEGRRS
ncbi:MAG: polyprenyl synthetase family protein [Leucobacter sp.]